MKKLGILTLVIALVITSIGFIDYTEASAKTSNKTGVTMSVSKCKTSSKTIESFSSAINIWDKIETIVNGGPSSVIELTKVKSGAYVTIKANEPGTLYVYLDKATSADTKNTIKGFTDKKLTKPARVLDGEAKSYEFSDFILTNYVTASYTTTVQYPMNTKEALYISIPADLNLAIYWLPATTMGSIQSVKSTGYQKGDTVDITWGGSENFSTGNYIPKVLRYNITNSLAKDYSILRINQFDAEVKWNKAPTNGVFTIKVTHETDTTKPIAMEALMGYDVPYKNAFRSNLMVIRCDDLTIYDKGLADKYTVAEPMYMVKGTNTIIGISPVPSMEEKQIFVKINNKKTYSTYPTYYTYNKYSWNWNKSAITGEMVNDIYCIVLKSNLKSGDKVTIWCAGAESAKTTYTVK